MATEKHAVIKVSDLSGKALDYVVAKCKGSVTGFTFDGIDRSFYLDGKLKVLAKGWAPSMSWHPSSNWAQGGPIIEREKINVSISTIEEWMAFIYDGSEMTWILHGQTPLIATMRCYVASKLGDTVEIPNELL